MYHTLVRRKIERIFSELSRGNFDFVLAGVAPRLEHSFAGDHPLGGVRHTPAALRLWFERLYHSFRASDLASSTSRLAGGRGTRPWSSSGMTGQPWPQVLRTTTTAST